MRAEPKVIQINEGELRAKLRQIEEAMGAEFSEPFRQLLDGHVTILELLRENDISIKRLQKLLFGSSSEKSSKIMPEEDNSPEPAPDIGASDVPSAAANKPQSKPRPGHGRIPASAYTGCEQVPVTHKSLHPGDSCPLCGQGTVYRQKEWSPVVCLVGRAPVGGTVYHLERLRCHLCGDVHTAELPEAVPQKYDPTVASIIATLRYGEGFPWNRIGRIQKAAGVPLPASTQWLIVRDAVRGGIEAAYDNLLTLAAEGELFHNDDTHMQVLELTKQLEEQKPLLEEDPKRRGIFTTNVLSRAEDRPTISLFFTGPHHAGENLKKVVASRRDELPAPIQMSDGLSRNIPKDFAVILANCLTHGRRKFVDLIEAFPTKVKHVIRCLKKVYQADAEARKRQLSPTERLQWHQQQSGPVMDDLHQWLQEQFDQRQVEPNSSLGKAISYMLNHWDKLTLFLRVAGAPLDNNICEQALKMAIRHRRNSLFYKTMNGARVGDLYMSLIHTCYLCSAYPFHYLTELQRNAARVIAAPGDWMPWNYHRQLGADETDSDASHPPPVEPTISAP